MSRIFLPYIVYFNSFRSYIPVFEYFINSLKILIVYFGNCYPQLLPHPPTALPTTTLPFWNLKPIKPNLSCSHTSGCGGIHWSELDSLGPVHLKKTEILTEAVKCLQFFREGGNLHSVRSGPVSWLCMWIPIFQAWFVYWRQSFSPCVFLREDQLSIYRHIYFWVLHYFEFTQYFGYCSSVTFCEIREYNASSFFFLPKTALTTQWYLWYYRFLNVTGVWLGSSLNLVGDYEGFDSIN